MRIAIHTFALLLPALLAAADRGKVADGLERLLYVADRSGVSVYDINDSHKLLRKIELPETGDYKGISASVQLGKLYLTSYVKDELVCVDLATEKMVWQNTYDGQCCERPQIAPDGSFMYVGSDLKDFWYVVNPRTGELIARVQSPRTKAR